MKKIALVVDFNTSFIKDNVSKHYDLFILDRFNNKIVDVDCVGNSEFNNPFQQEFTFEEFYQLLSKQYKEVFCLFVSSDSTNVDDYLLHDKINNLRKPNEAKIYTYLLDIMTQNKKSIVENTIEMIDKHFPIKDIIVRIHKIRKRDVFSLSDLLVKYLSYMI